MTNFEKEMEDAFADVTLLVDRLKAAKEKATEIQTKASQQLQKTIKETQEELKAVKAKQKVTKLYFGDIISKCQQIKEFVGKLV